MSQRAVKAMSSVALAYSLAFLPVLCAADEPATSPSIPEPIKRPDYSKYVHVTDVVGEVVKADSNKMTLRVTWYVPQAQGGSYRRPNLGANNGNYRNPYARNTGRQQPRVNYKEHHQDYDIDFVPESLVRTMSLPAKYDANGKRVSYSTAEIKALRTPAGASGYAASTTDLTPGTIVEVVLMRDKTIPASKATEADLRIKFAIIQGKDPHPPKDIANPKSDTKNKKAKN
ncbi:MAG TPA: hypothetical protein VLM40_09475 [Gemmata sp.]|nr:hypothetical protein [Gemmata sp.]